ncbi:hypothetical protein K2Y11_13135 [bacterium]|nr:hypothetical protein [bacterium]
MESRTNDRQNVQISSDLLLAHRNQQLLKGRWVGGIGAAMHAAVFGAVFSGATGIVLPDWLRMLLLAVLVIEIICFTVAAIDVRRYWFMLLFVIGLKVPGAIAGLAVMPLGIVDWKALLFAVVFDAVWSAVLIQVLARLLVVPSDQQASLSISEAIEGVKDQRGESLERISMANPVMVVFLRHFGCTFCREALSDLGRLRPEIEKLGTQLAIIHMSTDDEAEFMLGRYGLADVHRISDPFRRVYKAFELRRGTGSQLLGIRVWWRGLVAGLIKGHGIGPISGDALQLSGVFLLWKGKLVREFRHKTSADRPNYREIAACDACPS